MYKHASRSIDISSDLKMADKFSLQPIEHN